MVTSFNFGVREFAVVVAASLGPEQSAHGLYSRAVPVFQSEFFFFGLLDHFRGRPKNRPSFAKSFNRIYQPTRTFSLFSVQ
jgi:hypothetical protein